MDELIVLWEWLSSDSSDERSSLSGASSYVLDARDRLALPDLIRDPLPLQSDGARSGLNSPPFALESPPLRRLRAASEE